MRIVCPEVSSFISNIASNGLYSNTIWYQKSEHTDNEVDFHVTIQLSTAIKIENEWVHVECGRYCGVDYATPESEEEENLGSKEFDRLLQEVVNATRSSNITFLEGHLTE